MTIADEDLGLSLQQPCGRHRASLSRGFVRRCLRAALEAPAELTVRIVDAQEGQALNRDFRSKDYATNVLTFDYAQEPVVLADLVLCAPVVEREAVEQGRSLQAHYAHLLIHGALHAQGWDHETDEEARAMESLESALMTTLGFPDPYAPSSTAPIPPALPKAQRAPSRSPRRPRAQPPDRAPSSSRAASRAK